MKKNESLEIQKAGEVRQIKQREHNFMLQQEQTTLRERIEELEKKLKILETPKKKKAKKKKGES